MRTSLLATIWFVGGLLIIAAVACGSSPVNPAQAELDRHRELWEANRSGDYTFEYSPVCFCPRMFNQPVEVEVGNGVVESVTYVDSGESPGTNGFPPVHTIDGLFDKVQDAIDREATQLTVSYDPEIGYPVSASIDYSLNILDEEFSGVALGLGLIGPVFYGWIFDLVDSYDVALYVSMAAILAAIPLVFSLSTPRMAALRITQQG